MKLSQYQIEAKRTLPELENHEIDVLHMIMGVNTEIGEILDIYKRKIAYGKELNMIHLSEELGDTFWYLVNLCTLEDIELSDNELDFKDELKEFEKLFLNSGQLVIEKYFTFDNYFKSPETFSNGILCFLSEFNNLVLQRYIDTEVQFYVYGLYKMFCMIGIDVEKSLQNNIDKLKVRYPEKFDITKAINRDLESERKELEK